MILNGTREKVYIRLISFHFIEMYGTAICCRTSTSNTCTSRSSTSRIKSCRTTSRSGVPWGRDLEYGTCTHHLYESYVHRGVQHFFFCEFGGIDDVLAVRRHLELIRNYPTSESVIASSTWHAIEEDRVPPLRCQDAPNATNATSAQAMPWNMMWIWTMEEPFPPHAISHVVDFQWCTQLVECLLQNQPDRGQVLTYTVYPCCFLLM